MSAAPDQELTRKQRREQARAQRKALEQAERTRAARRKRLIGVGGALAALVVIATVAILRPSGGGRRMSAASAAAVGSGVSAGLRATTAPWQPEYSALETRLGALHLPTQSDSAYHIQVEVPAHIGIDPEGRSSHRFTRTMRPASYTWRRARPIRSRSAQFFTIWGVKFTNSQLGAYVANALDALSVYVNGTHVSDPVGYLMKPHDHIVVAYGRAGSFPTSFTYTFPEGL
jgi:hypothetical protein